MIEGHDHEDEYDDEESPERANANVSNGKGRGSISANNGEEDEESTTGTESQTDLENPSQNHSQSDEYSSPTRESTTRDKRIHKQISTENGQNHPSLNTSSNSPDKAMQHERQLNSHKDHQDDPRIIKFQSPNSSNQISRISQSNSDNGNKHNNNNLIDKIDHDDQTTRRSSSTGSAHPEKPDPSPNENVPNASTKIHGKDIESRDDELTRNSRGNEDESGSKWSNGEPSTNNKGAENDSSKSINDEVRTSGHNSESKRKVVKDRSDQEDRLIAKSDPSRATKVAVNDNVALDDEQYEQSPSPTENILKLSPSITRKPIKTSGSGRSKGGRLGGVGGPPFESGVNTECIQLLRQLWNVHEEAGTFLDRIRTTLCYFRRELRSHENLFESSFREKRLSSSVSFPNSLGSGSTLGKKFAGAGGVGVNINANANATNLDALSLISGVGGMSSEEESNVRDGWALVILFADGLKCISESFSDIERQFLTLSVFQSQCKLPLYAKIKHAKQQVTLDRMSIMHGVQQLINVTLQLLSTPFYWSQSDQEKRTGALVQSVFQLTQTFNWCLESSWAIPTEAALAAASSNTSLTSINSDQPDTQLGVLESASSLTTASGPKSKTTSSQSNKIRILVQIRAANRNDSPLLKLSVKPQSATRLLQTMAQKRSLFTAHGFSSVIFSNLYTDPGGVLGKEKFESCFTDEDSRLSPLGKGFSQCPSLLGRAAVKKSESGDQRLSRSARTKMYSYFHEVLWTLTGEHGEDLLLWGIHGPYIPLFLQPLELLLKFRNALMLGQHFQASTLSPMLSAFDSVGGALQSFSQLANWDEKMREGLEEGFKVKRPEQVALIQNPEPTQWATEIGSKFGQIITSCLSLIDYRSGTSRMISNEEEPLGDEAQTLFRLDATLVYFKAWVVKRAKVWLNGWSMPQFLAVSQREPALLVQLIKSREVMLITREFLLKHENVAIRLGATHREMCADDLRTALHQLQLMPEELLQAVGPVCSTLSLATLQSYMPSSNHWKGVGRVSGLDPDRPSSYVRIFIDRVINPVITASVELVPSTVQEAMGKQAVHAACDAWLQYILQKKIRFSEWGAVQLLRDFIAFREWIRTETELDKEARRAILQLEVLRKCEGVAYLLLRNPGDVLGVGKPTRKSRRVAPTSSANSVESSPSLSDSTAEDDIPPEMYVPNQQMWLELRLRRGVFTSPCCQ